MTLDRDETGVLGVAGGVPGAAGGPVPKVSVVVPVHNPGPSLERSIGSVLDQSMPTDQFEVIFVDDGSTDGSGDRLDALAAQHANIDVLHIPASGSPGRPRNTGIDHARGEYVQFLDADDRLGHRALERQYDMAHRNSADIVIGKLGSNFRGVHWGLFRRNIEAGSLATSPVIVNLTVCKMFRTALLREHGIRFPEGWPKIEDEHFVVRSYLAARTISVVADESCYLYCGRDDGGNLSSQPLDPDQYYGHLGEILALIEDAVPAGPHRANLKRRFFNVEMLGRLSGEAFLALDAAERGHLVDAVRGLMAARIDQAVLDGLTPVQLLRASLLREGRGDGLVELADRERGIRLHVTATGIEAVLDGIRIRYRVAVRWGDGSPFVLVRDGDRLLLDPRLVDGLATDEDDVSVDPQALQLQAALHEQDGWLDWMVKSGGPIRLEPVDSAGPPRSATPVATGTLVVDPGAPGPSARSLTAGRWAVMLRLRGLGIDLREVAVADARVSAPGIVAILHDPVGVARSQIGDGSVLELVVEEGAQAVNDLFRERGPAVLSRKGAPSLQLPAHVGPVSRPHLGLALGTSDITPILELPTVVHPDRDRSGGYVIESRRPSGPLPAGERVLQVRIGDDVLVPIGSVLVDPAGHIRVLDIPVVSRFDGVRRAVVNAWWATTTAVHRAGRSVRRRRRAGR